MPTCLQFTLSNPTPGQEDEFNRWYGTDHLIHGVLTPGVLAGQRFRRAPGPWPQGKHDYLMIWEFDDPAYALEQLAISKGTATMPLSPAIDMETVQPPTMWRRAVVRNAARIATDTAQRKAVVLLLANAAEGEDAAFVDGVMRGGLAALADLPGVLNAEFLTLADEQIRGNARKYRYAGLVELADESAGVASLTERLPALPHMDAERWFAPVFRPIGDRMSTAQARALEAETA
jgi:hypothetical protein